MNPISLILWTIIYRPIFNIIVLLLALFNWNLWLAIIWLTIIIRLALLKFSVETNNLQKDLVDIQPRLKELQEKYKDDPQKLGEEAMKLFKQSGTNPFKWCIMILIQIPIFLGLFYVITSFTTIKTQQLDIAIQNLLQENTYSFLYPLIETLTNWNFVLNHYFLWFDLFEKWWIAWLILAIITWVLMYIQIKLTTLAKPFTPIQNINSIPWVKLPDISKIMGMMNITLIIMMAFFVLVMPRWIWVYIVTTTLFTVLQLAYQYKELIKIKLKTLKIK